MSVIPGSWFVRKRYFTIISQGNTAFFITNMILQFTNSFSIQGSVGNFVKHLGLICKSRYSMFNKRVCYKVSFPLEGTGWSDVSRNMKVTALNALDRSCGRNHKILTDGTNCVKRSASFIKYSAEQPEPLLRLTATRWRHMKQKCVWTQSYTYKL